MKFLLVIAVLTAGLAGLVGSLQETSVNADGALASADQTGTTLRSELPDSETTLISDAPATTITPRAGAALRVADDVAAPVRIRVERLGIDLDIAAVGVDATGDFDVPHAGIGWYRYGSAPGEDGSAVLAAHVDYGGAPGAFFQLETLAAGDVIEIDRSDGSTHTFEVVEQILYDKSVLPADDLFARDGDSMLRLITCGGAFDPDDRSYAGNRVVTARPLAQADQEPG